MKRLLAATLIFLCAPTLALAAGFPSQSLFLSKSSVTEGDTVQIHVAVSNDSATKFTGELLLTDGQASIGSIPVTLGAGEADTVSLSWKPTAGVHVVTADLHDAAKNSLGQESATFTIAAKTLPTVSVAASSSPPIVVDSSLPIQTFISGLSPSLGKTVQPFFSSVDSGRAIVSKALGSGIAWTKSQVAQSAINGPGIKGFNDNKPATTTILGTVTNTGRFMLATLGLYLFSILQYVFANAGIFYPFLAFLFLYTLWRIYKRMRRPRY